MQKKKHILVISQYFYPEMFRINDMCAEWVKRGYQVTVLTGIPNYPMGKIFDGYGFTKKRKETWKGMNIIRIPLIPRGSGSIGMILNYLSFVVSGFFWSLFTRLKVDQIFMYEVSPMTQALIGVWYKKKVKVPCYLYVQDLWPENVETVTGIHSPIVIRPIEKMVEYIYKHCDQIFATSQSFVTEIQKRVEDREKVKYWPQYAEEFYCPLPHSEMEGIPGDDYFKICFTGNMGLAQGLDVLPKVANVLKNEKIRFVMVGDGRYLEEFQKEISELGVSDMFCMFGRKPAEEIPAILSACHMAFISFKDTELFERTIPAKLQSYLACGMPIIAAASGETKKIVENADCGYCCAIGDEKALAEAILNAKNDLELEQKGARARQYFEKHFDKKTLMDEMDTYFN